MAQNSENRKNQRARAEAKKADARKAEADAKRAESESLARKAEAEARALEAKVKADAETARIAAERSKQEAADAMAKQRADAQAENAGVRAGFQTAAIAAGLFAGHKKAKSIDARFAKSVEAKQPQVKALGDEIGKSKPGSKLKSAARAADKLKLTRTKAPLGLPLAAALVVEAGVARFVVSPGLDDAPVAQAVTDAVATGSTIAAISMVGQQAINRATPAAVPDAVAMANIEGARKGEVVFKAEKPAKPMLPDEVPAKKAAKPAGPPAPGTKEALRLEAKAKGIPNAGKLGKAALEKALGRAVLPVVAGVAAISAFSTASHAGESRSEAAGEAGLAVADVVTGGAVSSFRAEKARSGSTALATIAGVVEGAANVLTFGAAGLLSAAASGPAMPYVPETVAKRRAGVAYINAAAQTKVGAAPSPMSARPSTLGLQTASDGKISYTTRDGRTVQATQAQATRWRNSRKAG